MPRGDDRAFFVLYFYHIEAKGNWLGLHHAKVGTAYTLESLTLTPIDRIVAADEGPGRSRPHFDKHDRFAMQTNQIDLVPATPPIAGENLVPLLLQQLLRLTLASPPDGSRLRLTAAEQAFEKG